MPAQRIFAVRSTRLTRALLAAAAMFALTGCPTQSVIRGIPGVSNGVPATVGNPVHITLDWSGVPYHDLTGHVSVDGVGQDATFGIVSSCCTGAATLFLSPGAHQVSFSVGRGSMGPYQEVLPFNVTGTGITLTPTPASVTLAPGGSATVNVVATAPAPFNGSITPSMVTGLPAGVTATTTSTGAMAFSVGLTAAAGAPNGTSTAAISATVGGCTVCLGTLTPTAGLGVSVVGPGIAITGTTPSTLLVPRAGSQTVNFTVTRSGGFTGPIMITATGFSGAFTAPATTIAAGSNTGSITFSAKDSAGLAAIAGGSVPATQTATVTLTCVGTCTGTPPARTITLRVGHRLGAFAVAPASLKSAGSKTSADNASTLQYALRNPPYPNHTLFTATFRRANTGTTQLAAIDLEQSPIDWGAGFCTASPTVAGLVLSQPYGGQTNAQLYYDLPIWAPPPSTAAARVVSTQSVYTNVGNVALSVTPQLWYSPDCTIAAFPSATGVQAQPSALTIIDMRTGNQITTQMPFTGAFPTNLEVVGNAVGDSVKVTFTTTDIRKVPIP
ncbi:MAG TPA: hypothetical protein VF761_00485 [Gemmatimonadaceae bacterium]